MELKNIFKALALFQQECPIIHKGTTGYGYSYADLPEILSVINPILAKNKLGFTQLIQENTIKTVLFHYESGESIESVICIPQNVNLKGMNDFQVLGSAITYLKRYALSSMLGIVTDKDTDASGTQKTTSYPQTDDKKAMDTSEQQKTTPSTQTAAQKAIEEVNFAIKQMQECDSLDSLKEIWSKYNYLQTNPKFLNAKDLKKAQFN